MSSPASDLRVFRPQIVERRTRLAAAAHSLPDKHLNDLLAEVDAALEKIDHGVFGLCETCHEQIEADRLLANPMVRWCLDHLSGRELEAHQQDIELAARIQSKLLPRAGVAPGTWDTHYLYEPAGPVGGDYCELMVLEDGKSVFFAVGDVSGKGVAASLLMTHLSAILRSLLSLRLPLAEMISRANRVFCEGTLASHYATLVCGRATGEGVELTNAGHCRPLLLRGAKTERLESAGLPLGLFCGVEYPVTHVSLGAGDSLVFYSDGITESRDAAGVEFGESGLTESLRRHFGGSAEALARGAVEDAGRFRGGSRPADDLTVLVVRRPG